MDTLIMMNSQLCIAINQNPLVLVTLLPAWHLMMVWTLDIGFIWLMATVLTQHIWYWIIKLIILISTKPTQTTSLLTTSWSTLLKTVSIWLTCHHTAGVSMSAGCSLMRRSGPISTTDWPGQVPCHRSVTGNVNTCYYVAWSHLIVLTLLTVMHWNNSYHKTTLSRKMMMTGGMKNNSSSTW